VQLLCNQNFNGLLFTMPMYAHHERSQSSVLRTCDLPKRRPEAARPANASALVGTNTTDEPMTSGLSVTRPESGLANLGGERKRLLSVFAAQVALP
jgi:hypothetical protein